MSPLELSWSSAGSTNICSQAAFFTATNCTPSRSMTLRSTSPAIRMANPWFVVDSVNLTAAACAFIFFALFPQQVTHERAQLANEHAGGYLNHPAAQLAPQTRRYLL